MGECVKRKNEAKQSVFARKVLSTTCRDLQYNERDEGSCLVEVVMTTKEAILAEIDALDEEHLAELYRIIEEFVRSKRQSEPPSLMARLRRIKIQGPEDLAVNHDLYATGAKRLDADIR